MNGIEILKSFELSPTIRANVTATYEALANYLENDGHELVMYPIGSMAYGTAIKPHYQQSEKVYDLDVVCRIVIDEQKTAKEARTEILNSLQKSERYKPRIENDESCITLVFNGTQSFEFKVDIVVARKNKTYVEEENNLIDISKHYKTSNSFKWIESGSESAVKYFNRRNQKFITTSKLDYARKEGVTVEEIPKFIVSSELQKAIKILKRLRDIFYDMHNMEKEKIVSSHYITFAMLELTEKFDGSESCTHLISGFINGTFSMIDPIMQTNMLDGCDITMFNTWNQYLKKNESKLINILTKSPNYEDMRTLSNYFGEEATENIFGKVEKIKEVNGVKPWGNVE